MRVDRTVKEMRKIEILPNYSEYAEGSVLISFGKTKVLCNASVEEKVPPFIKEKGTQCGWITAEYNMLPRATLSRTTRERGRVGGRTQEIQRLIGRALRTAVDLEALGPRTITLDCDVLQADGGTRTTAISGAFIALNLALKSLKTQGLLSTSPLRTYIAAISVGKVKGEFLLDLDYEEDHQAEVDMNIVMTDNGEFVELQGTGEQKPFSEKDFSTMLQLAKSGINQIIKIQKQAIEAK